MNKELQVISDLEVFYKRMTKGNASLIRKMFKNSPFPVLEKFVRDQLFCTGILLMEKALPGREAFHICIRCWKKDPIGIKDLRACLAAGEGRPYYFCVIISTSGFTKQAVKFAQNASRPILLIHLDELIMLCLSKKTPRIRSPRHDMQFLP